jgi:hypothetical protein
MALSCAARTVALFDVEPAPDAKLAVAVLGIDVDTERLALDAPDASDVREPVDGFGAGEEEAGFDAPELPLLDAILAPLLATDGLETDDVDVPRAVLLPALEVALDAPEDAADFVAVDDEVLFAAACAVAVLVSATGLLPDPISSAIYSAPT